MKNFRILILAIAVVAVAAMSMTAISKTRADKDMPEDTYDIKAFLDPKWELAMHEVFTHYLQAAANFGEGNYDMAISFLKVMEFYIDMLPSRIPEKLPDGKAVDKKLFADKIEELRKNTISLRKMIERKDYANATKVAPEFVTNLCAECHKKAQVPPKWQIGGYKVE